MTKQAETKLLDFLFSKDNLPFVVDILGFGDQIRKRLLTAFWTEVNDCLQSYAAKPSLVSTSMQVQLFAASDPIASEVYFLDVSLDAEEHYLRYILRLARWKNSITPGYGVVGRYAFKDVPNGLYRLPPVLKLIEHLESMGLKQPGKEYGSLGYSEIRPYEPLDEFLAFFVHDKESMLETICDTFWRLVNETVGLVEDANKSLVQAVRAK